MPHDPRLITDEANIEALRDTIPDWIKRLERPKTPCVAPAFGPLEGIRAVGTGQLIAQPYIGTKLAEFGAEVVHVEKPGGRCHLKPARYGILRPPVQVDRRRNVVTLPLKEDSRGPCYITCNSLLT